VLVFAAGASLIIELSADIIQELIETSIALRRPQTTMLVVHGHGGGRREEPGGGSAGAGGGRRRRRRRQGEVAVEVAMDVDDDVEMIDVLMRTGGDLGDVVIW
jgi:hypothetical protein